MKVLVTGGAGYIGSHTCKELAKHGLEPVVYDNMRQGHRWAVRWGPLEIGDLLDTERLGEVMRAHTVQAVVHFAALALVGESVVRPDLYYLNNVAGSLSLLRAMQSAGVDRLVFSSSCAVYGHPRSDRIGEDHPREPVNPYGRTKKIVEEMFSDFGMRSLSLRYFNAAGADAQGELGEVHDPETHAIPNALAVARGRQPYFTLHGADYPTPDGSCVRDYVHVADLARAHRLALQHMPEGVSCCNLGTGQGVSVREMLAAVRRHTGRPVPERAGPRRPGDPAQLVADPGRAQELLGWRAQCSDLDTLVSSAWAWECRA